MNRLNCPAVYKINELANPKKLKLLFIYTLYIYIYKLSEQLLYAYV